MTVRSVISRKPHLDNLIKTLYHTVKTLYHILVLQGKGVIRGRRETRVGSSSANPALSTSSKRHTRTAERSKRARCRLLTTNLIGVPRCHRRWRRSSTFRRTGAV